MGILKTCSNELKTMLQNKEGYRNEMFVYDGGSGNIKRCFIDVFKFEVFELGNTDIFDTMKKFYSDNLISNYELPTDDLRANFIYTMEYIENLLRCYRTDLKCVWLTTYQGVKNLYYDNADDIELRRYIITVKMMPVSDLGIDGALFVYRAITDTPEYIIMEG